MQITPRGDIRYVSVVLDTYRQGERRVRTLQSFGPETPESLARAYQFKANCEAVREFASRTDPEKNRDAIIAVFGLILGIAIIALLLSNTE